MSQIKEVTGNGITSEALEISVFKFGLYYFGLQHSVVVVDSNISEEYDAPIFGITSTNCNKSHRITVFFYEDI